MSDLPKAPPVDWLNTVGKPFFDAWDYDQEAALTLARRIWEEPRFAQMKGEEAVKAYLQEVQEKRDRLYGGPRKPIDAWVEAYKNEWATHCAGEYDLESLTIETYDLWDKHYQTNPKVVAMQRFIEVYTPAERERYRQLTQKNPWIDLTE